MNKSVLRNTSLRAENFVNVLVIGSEFTDQPFGRRLIIANSKLVVLDRSSFYNNAGYFAFDPAKSRCMINFFTHNPTVRKMRSSQLLIRSCTFNNNTANYGRTLCIATRNATIQNSTFTHNSGSSGGAVSTLYCRFVQIYNCVFANNSAWQFGGTLYNAGNVDIVNIGVDEDFWGYNFFERFWRVVQNVF